MSPVHIFTPYFFTKIHFNIILQFTSGLSECSFLYVLECSLSFRFYDLSPVCTSHLS
jgi:hypothetical protein